VAGAGETAARKRLPGEIVAVHGRVESGTHGGGPVRPVTLPLEELLERQRELPCVSVLTGVRGFADRSLQYVALGCEPSHRLRVPG
jgi:hypothetical protein